MSDPVNMGAVEQLRSDLTTTLSGLGVMQSVPIIDKRAGDALTQINAAFASAGVFGEVTIHRTSVQRAQCKAILLLVDFVVDFYENVSLNQTSGTRKGAWGLAEATLQALNYEKVAGYQHIITVSEGGPILEDVTKDPDGGTLVVRVRLSTMLELPAPIPS